MYLPIYLVYWCLSVPISLTLSVLNGTIYLSIPGSRQINCNPLRSHSSVLTVRVLCVCVRAGCRFTFPNGLERKSMLCFPQMHANILDSINEIAVNGSSVSVWREWRHRRQWQHMEHKRNSGSTHSQHCRYSTQSKEKCWLMHYAYYVHNDDDDDDGSIHRRVHVSVGW